MRNLGIINFPHFDIQFGRKEEIFKMKDEDYTQGNLVDAYLDKKIK
jgi:hypothetical protein